MFTWPERYFTACAQAFCHYWPQRTPEAGVLKRCRIISHRGEYDNQHIYENTLAAFTPLLQHQVWGVEFDMRWSKDGVPLVFHDEDLLRLFDDHTKLDELDYSQLKIKYPMIPSLQQLVEQLGKKIHLVIELKDLTVAVNAKVRQNFMTALSTLQAGHDFHIISFYPETFTALSAWPSQTFLPIAYCWTKKLEQMIYHNQYAGILGHYWMLKQSLIKRIHRQNALVGTGQINSINCMKRECKRQVDWIFSDRALALQRYLKEI